MHVCQFILPEKKDNLALNSLLAGLSALLISSILVLVVMSTANMLTIEILTEVVNDEAKISDAIGLIFIAPLVETFILIGLLKVLLKAPLNDRYICVISALFWGGVHGLFIPISFFGTVWNFYIFSHCYLTWIDKSKKEAYFAALFPHMIINSVVALVLFL
jgi:hypothetical protein